MLTTMTSRGLLAAFCLALALPAAAEPQGPPRGAWIVTAISGAPLDNDRSRFELTEDRIAGASGCNRFSGRFETSAGGGVKAGAMAATKMACPEPFMTQERDFFRALAAVTGWRWRDGSLMLIDAAGEAALRLRQAP